MKFLRSFFISLCVLLFANTIFATDDWSLTYPSPPTSFDCGTTSFTAGGSTLAWHMPASGTISIEAIEQVNGVQSYTYSAGINYGDIVISPASIVSGVFPTEAFPYIWSRTFTATVDGVIYRTWEIQIQCNGLGDNAVVLFNDFTTPLPSVGEPPTEVTPPPFVLSPDDRLNWQYGDSGIGILYANSNAGLDLYLYADNSYLSDWVTADDLATYTDTPPEQNTLIKQTGLARFYALQSGGFMLVLGPDAEGKAYRITLNPALEVVEMTYSDPNE